MADHHRFTPFERECILSLDDPGSSEWSSGEDEGSAAPGGGGGGSGVLWDDYEAAALATVRLYQGKGWREFQVAAAATTQLYKDSMESSRRAKEAGRAAGRARLMKELVGYLRSGQGRGPFVRRQDLLALLAGRSPPPARTASSGGSPVVRRLDALRLSSPSVPATTTASAEGLVMFHQALTHEPLPTGHASPRRHHLHRFFLEQRVSVTVPVEPGGRVVVEVRRHRKRGVDEAESAPESPAALKRRRL